MTVILGPQFQTNICKMMDSVNSLACDDNQILYVGYGGDSGKLSRYDVANDVWLQVISANQASIADGGTDSDMRLV